MRKKSLSLAIACLALVGLTFGYGRAQGRSVEAQGDCQTFTETGKTVCGKFLQYWKDHGGLAQQGLPISGEFKETSEIDGKSYTVQYFERAVFELHLENKAPYDVLLSLLGTMALRQKYPNGAPAPPTAFNPNTGMHFPETDQWVNGEFLDYWKAHGGLAQQGFPISGRFSEKSDLDGKLYTVQYFERAVFELHPENPAPNNVLLSQLGTARFKAKYPGGQPGIGTPLQAGQWGGQHITMAVTAGGATIEFDCAHATISQALTVSSTGQVDVTGMYVQEHGGPTMVGDDQQGRPARFSGTSDGKTLTLTITYADDNTKIGSFTAVLGNQGQIRKCL